MMAMEELSFNSGGTRGQITLEPLLDADASGSGEKVRFEKKVWGEGGSHAGVWPSQTSMTTKQGGLQHLWCVVIITPYKSFDYVMYHSSVLPGF
ncbi:hypothetical protein GQ55_7G301300 [Panicum hallii var. hallii]|jgi:hypothetical protein|uniref:Uncharacterized protein n=1 Tax=Panicum hallii var. hallii TaxID=1504633 RepID=A0A2T7D0M7_9POAL|nr:hypothetical protein GQ55_7G301300 [Panicum hallii var. hallii]